MTLRVALRSLLARPVRSAVLACGFGFGVSVMAALLGVGDVILEQSQAPALRGGGDLLVSGVSGRLASALFVRNGVLANPPFAGRVAAASPSSSGWWYLIEPGGATALRVLGGIPSLERALHDPEIAQVPAWNDSESAARWTRADPAQALRAIDRFHAIPAAPGWEDSWAEWLYFNGRSADEKTRFYLTFLVGPRSGPDRRRAGVRLQLERDGRSASFARGGEVAEAALLASAPDLDIAGSSVRLDGLVYRLSLALDPGLTGELTLAAAPGRSAPPIVLRGARGWISGYVVPVLAGGLDGVVRENGGEVRFDGGAGYHDHNWGFWKGVTWQWGQVAHDDLALVWGRVIPPPDAADADRVPAFLAAIGRDGPLGYASGITIRETGAGPAAVSVEAHDGAIALTIAGDVKSTVHNPMAGGLFATTESTFLQMRADFRVRGTVAGRAVDFEAPGSAETFRAW